MPSTLLITGCSSGIGRATVEYFSARGWQVAATMRHPERETALQQLPGVKLYALDVTDQASVTRALEAAIKDFGSLDTVVNNAGYGAVGSFEKATDQEIRHQFDTNVFGVMNVTRGILPYFRARRQGLIINVTSMGGLITFPLYSVYHATKWAIEGFAESLAFEVRPFNIRIKNIEPGVIKTDFYDRSMRRFSAPLDAYDAYEERVFANMQMSGVQGPGPSVVAEEIFRAANGGGNRLRYPVGGKAPLLVGLRKLLPDAWFRRLIRAATEKT